jgi:hypothetical protein
MLGMSAALEVKLPRGGWVRFASHTGHRPILFRDERDIQAGMEELTARVDELLEEMQKIHDVELVDVKSYEADQLLVPIFPDTVLMTREGSERFVLRIGANKAPLSTDAAFDNCPYHDYGPAFAEGFGTVSIQQPSTNPRANFPSGSRYHCAHKSAHTLRRETCQLTAVDEFLCCRRCVLQERCWPSGFSQLPCKQTPSGGSD